jgi:hypothetical protein
VQPADPGFAAGNRGRPAGERGLGADPAGRAGFGSLVALDGERRRERACIERGRVDTVDTGRRRIRCGRRGVGRRLRGEPTLTTARGSVS